jgi:hypothetical protein
MLLFYRDSQRNVHGFRSLAGGIPYGRFEYTHNASFVADDRRRNPLISG